MTSSGHLTSSVTSPFDFARSLSYGLPIVNNYLSPVIVAHTNQPPPRETVTGHFGHKTLRHRLKTILHQKRGTRHFGIRSTKSRDSGQFGPRKIPTRHSSTGDSTSSWCRSVLVPKYLVAEVSGSQGKVTSAVGWVTSFAARCRCGEQSVLEMR